MMLKVGHPPRDFLSAAKLRVLPVLTARSGDFAARSVAAAMPPRQRAAARYPPSPRLRRAERVSRGIFLSIRRAPQP